MILKNVTVLKIFKLDIEILMKLLNTERARIKQYRFMLLL